MESKFYKIVNAQEFAEQFPQWLFSFLNEELGRNPFANWAVLNNSKMMQKYKMELIPLKSDPSGLRAIGFKTEKHFMLFCLSYKRTL